MVLNALNTLALAGAALATSCAIEVSSRVASPSASELKGLLMSMMALPARACPYSATIGTTLSYNTATMTMLLMMRALFLVLELSLCLVCAGLGMGRGHP